MLLLPLLLLLLSQYFPSTLASPSKMIRASQSPKKKLRIFASPTNQLPTADTPRSTLSRPGPSATAIGSAENSSTETVDGGGRRRGGGGGSVSLSCSAHAVCRGGPCRHRPPTTSTSSWSSKPPSRRIVRHRDVKAVLSVDREGYTLTNGRTTVCVDGGSGNRNAEMTRDVANMGVTRLFVPNRHSFDRWMDAMESRGGGEDESFGRRFEVALLKDDRDDEKRKWCPFCGKTTCHRYNAIPSAVRIIFPNFKFLTLRH